MAPVAFAASATSSIAAGVRRIPDAVTTLARRAGLRAPAQQSIPPDAEFDYVVVGSGAGGGTVAARLAEAGYSVVVLEAGGDHAPANYQVPAFHAFATEDRSMRWDFFVHHYDSPSREQLDPNYETDERAFWYPRAGTLGGCTAHNAMIFVYPHRADWDQIADMTGDRSWSADNMRQYFERLENCHHRPFRRFWHALGSNKSRHGFEGWLRTEKASADDAIREDNIRRLVAQSAGNILKDLGAPSLARLESLADPNDWRVNSRDEVGARYTPLTTHDHVRTGTRERLLETKQRHPDLLTIELNALAARVILDGDKRARGVEYLKGERLYQAHPTPNTSPGERRRVFAKREVILAGGAFNTPQLLMLSGIGPRDVLTSCGIDVSVQLEEVGKNLQDRYEVAVVNRMPRNWELLEGATFTTEDAQYRQWRDERKGIYTTNGAVLSVITRSMPGQPSPDLFCYSVLADFRGYKRGYSKRIRERLNCLTWVVLKGHTNNTGGEVRITSRDPWVRPSINFKYFEDGTAGADGDVKAVVEGVRLVRRLADGLEREIGLAEELPGRDCQTQEQLEEFVKTHAWGHHASCTCRIGPRDRGGVLGGDFTVHGTRGLRVVDASVFPRVPGLFIVSAVYMIAEKAADAIIATAKARTPADA
jgi:choline dehydrogenase-like flavoprotein